MKRSTAHTTRFSAFAALMALLGTAGLIAPAQAQLDLTLTPSDLGVQSGQTVTQTFTATLTNHYNYDLYLNGDFFTVDTPLSLDDSKFLNAFLFPMDTQGNLLPQPTLSANGGTATLDIFDLTVPVTADGVYNGVFGIEHGALPGDTFDVTAANFIVEVNPTGTASNVPEPGTLALLGAFALSGGVWHHSRQRRTRETE